MNISIGKLNFNGFQLKKLVALLWIHFLYLGKLWATWERTERTATLFLIHSNCVWDAVVVCLPQSFNLQTLGNRFGTNEETNFYKLTQKISSSSLSYTGANNFSLREHRFLLLRKITNKVLFAEIPPNFQQGFPVNFKLPSQALAWKLIFPHIIRHIEISGNFESRSRTPSSRSQTDSGKTLGPLFQCQRRWI